MNGVAATIGNITIVLGALVFATAALGLVRFPDAYTRISAVGTAGGIGIVLVVGGALLHQPNFADLVKVLVIVAVQLTTSAVGSMAIARSAYLSHTPVLNLRFDELTQPAEDDG
ncbi:cation:proton antiporter [Mycobacterium sp. smrl_JER01]|uniref:cation:proton antiporter n=1 Tax=Mycobacterium sp. smrl_JER01 TaxID=3402633 RepID=UPI003ACB8C44